LTTVDDAWCVGAAAGDVEWLKSLPASSTGPPSSVPTLQQATDVDEHQQRQHIQQMLLAMQHSMPSRWAAPPAVATTGHVMPGATGHVLPGPRPTAMHPGIAHANHVPAAPSADSAVVEHSTVSFGL